jgi:uncharacterized FlaG/YvyC family protein
MDPISPISSVSPATPQTALTPAPRPQDQALNAALSGAVWSLNEAGYAGTGRQITLSFDPASRRPVIEVVDSETNKVLLQWPSAYVLELAHEQNKRADSGRYEGYA